MRLSVPSFAKITWMLEVLGPRPDGYHEIRAVLQTVDLADTLHFEPTEGRIEVSCSHPDVPEGEGNLVFRAAHVLQRARGIRAGVRVRIEKRIPVAAGLGGGSSNAAITLLALGRLWDVALEPDEVLQLGRTLGSDVPFFFFGGTALAVGRGDEVYPLPEVQAEYLLLAHPGFAVPTPWAYRQLTKRDMAGNISLCSRTFHRIVWKSEGGEKVPRPSEIAVGNDFEEIMRRQYPEWAEGLDLLRRQGAQAVGLSGSGPTLFAVFEGERELRRAEDVLASRRWWRARTRTLTRPQYWERLRAGGV